ncbi:Bipartite prolipoprotein diacylglyceryl transferase and phosphatase domain [Alteracholeplasma palmae J233]|uniref:Phosphatidylglycerol--prolipoprotein diacylglyceryl transferase n=1 Tax=Alteracholeplasma palmae (strain ATCC 49389 / J233) TaxID=1318466 RepID=U4KJT6_ALTPJ|nr:prolipoprotein diacylglyceryl transferase [Alteracholeplasma palmae]CCV63712.1 Bipartite prolipoprotein diacylglyceryl transferase and phosphatase domain [Alteracholeplasma palmae J233]
MKNKKESFLKVYENHQSLFVIGGFILYFLLLVLLATVGQTAPYRSYVVKFSLPAIGNVEITWYAVFILSGIVLAAIAALREFKKAGINPNILYDGLLYCVPLAIIGARLWFVLFNPGTNFFAFTDGGLGIHGAIIVTFVFLIFYTKWKKVSYWFVLDVVAPGFLIGQVMGRWGNFMNQELYGPKVSHLNYLPKFISEQMYIHGSFRQPTFLYESIWNLFGLVLILILRKKKIFKLGDILAFYLGWYGIGRIFIEVLRIQSGSGEPLGIGGAGITDISQWYLSTSILTSIGLILAGIAIFILKRYFVKGLPYYSEYGRKAILFDLDGTLIDTEKIIIASFEYVFKKWLPNVKLTAEDKKSFVGPTLHQTFSRYSSDEKEIEKLITEYRKYNKTLHDKGVKAYPNAKETLDFLKVRGIRLGIVSSKARVMVEEGLKQNDLLQYFEVLVCSDDVENHKPHPEPLLKAIKALNAPIDTTIYVGDHSNDVLAAKRAGMISCLVEYSTHLKEALQNNPDYVIEGLEQLKYLI